MIAEPVLDLANIQGAITPGFNKDYQHLVFLRIRNPDAAKAALREIAPLITSSHEALAARSLWRSMRDRLGHEPGELLPLVHWGCAFTATGLSKLTSDADVAEFGDEAFKVGMQERSVMLGDPAHGEGSIEQWLYGGNHNPVDMLATAAGDSEPELEKEVDRFIIEMERNGLELVHRDRGRVQGRNLPGHEHFGFRDGVSQPAMRGRRSDKPDDFYEGRTWAFIPDPPSRQWHHAGPGRPLVWPGHFLFGYPRQERDAPEQPMHNNLPKGPAWAQNGSFLVSRRLRQYVSKFDNFLRDAARSVQAVLGADAPSAERLGAMMVGRWKSGTPLILNPDSDTAVPESCMNEFTFSTERFLPTGDGATISCPADSSGQICPLGAHIRKVNPRDDATDLGNPERTLQKMILRRGITFDCSFDPAPSDDRGLLFLSYQSSITSQFEFLMTDWVNREEKPVGGAGHDPILAQGSNREIHLTLAAEPITVPIPGSWVVTTGGAYLFAPPISFFAGTPGD